MRYTSRSFGKKVSSLFGNKVQGSLNEAEAPEIFFYRHREVDQL